MFSQIELGRIGGIPIFLDMMFVLLLIVFSYPYFTSGDSQIISAGLIIVAGVLVSILLHELGHAFAGRLFGVRVTHIELTPLGGLAHFERALPPSVLARTVISLAGPAANLVLWIGLERLANAGIGLDHEMLALTLLSLAGINFYLLVFNLLPAYPLDGGHTLDALLGGVLRYDWAVRIVASLGLLVALGLAVTALPSNFLRLLLAFFLFQVNWSQLERVGGWKR